MLLTRDVWTQVGQWFGQRALEVDTRSGQLSCAGAVLQLSGRADAPQTVRDMQEAVHSLRDIVQSGAHCCPDQLRNYRRANHA